MGRTLELFDKPPSPRVIRMHVSDAGEGDADNIRVRYFCARCQYETDWLMASSITEAKRGIPCPHCNPQT